MRKEDTLATQLVHLARLAMQTDHRQVEAFLRRLARQQRRQDPTLADQLESLVSSQSPETVMNATRKVASSFVPVDGETRLDLLRIEHPDSLLEEPVLLPAVAAKIAQIIAERLRTESLLREGIEPSRTVLFTGLPGVGKTLTARWIAKELHQPLLTLDLSTVMSSFLGRTGSNLRAVLEYAKRANGILFLDEFDAVAKRRSDDTEVGELKRLVTVLLQEIDHWPADRLLIAATNHGELLDPAVWRRFDVVVDFPFPLRDGLISLAEKELGGIVANNWAKALAVAMTGHSFSDLVRLIRSIRRYAIISGQPIEERLLDVIKENLQGLSKSGIKDIALELESAGIAQRQISELTGLSRDTIRRARLDRELQDGGTH